MWICHRPWSKSCPKKQDTPRLSPVLDKNADIEGERKTPMLTVEPGSVFGRLVVVREVPKRGVHRLFLCRCACGEDTVVQRGHLVSGHSASCGCLGRTSGRTHGKHDIPEHRVWSDMKQRCTNPKHRGYKNYGGRGIAVCDRWVTSFEDFLSDMGERTSSEHSIERIDNDGPYSPENCRWATQKEQCNNQRKTKLVTFGEDTLCLLDWSKQTGIPYGTLNHRLYRLGLPPEEALNPRLELPKGRASWRKRQRLD